MAASIPKVGVEYPLPLLHLGIFSFWLQILVTPWLDVELLFVAD
jgi:hypothetical protein